MQRGSSSCEPVLRSLFFLLVGMHLSVAHSSAQRMEIAQAELKKLSLEQLLEVEVTSVSRREERANVAAAAVHVVTEEDIRRSGARSLPEALRLAPNLHVAQYSSRGWAISARGFNASFSNKLLVLIDGRTVYSPLFSGVFWDAQDTLLEDIDRIEVISGPGNTVWGANAVNGVINIITKSARDTAGILASVSSGSTEPISSGIRYGGKAGATLNYRVYAKYFERDDSLFSNGDSASDAWRSGQAGLRMDWQPDRENLLTLQGDAYGGNGDQISAGDLRQAGGNLLARWTRTFAINEELQIQTYYDRTHQFVPEDFGDDLDTLDVDAQYERDLGQRQHLMVGAGYRYIRDRVKNLPGSIAFLPANLDRHLFSALVQGETALLDDRVKLTIGSKFEHNDYTGLEVQPSGRVAWKIASHTIWGAISRAVRTPSRFDRHLFFPADPPFIFAGGPEFDSEKMIAYELGWRFRPHQSTFVSIATFFNDYDDVRSTSLGPPFVTENNVEAEILGAELQGTWQPTESSRFTAGYTVLGEDFRVKPGKSDLNSGQGEAFDPKHRFHIRGSLNLSPNIELDMHLRTVDSLGTTGRGFGKVPAYTTLDARIGWAPIKGMQFALVGQNLFDKRHAEFGSREIARSVYLKATWRR
jgi:iron complex outermembrane recepter protein